MAIAKTRIHMICGICGCNEEFEFEINPTGNCNNDGEEYPSVTIVCNNCSSITNLDELMEDKTEAHSIFKEKNE